ncbi:hypothetical protein R4Z10_07600 [Niallia sp. XMNu-256]|uniref:hypothetical protein n=1 Tax=Niallia sp. XMNu-256 TaxID=3082444 RepID=UPI0030CCA413
MDKREVGIILGISSILPAIISILIFFITRGPDADIYFDITIYGTLSIIGILLAIFSWTMSKRIILLMIGLIGNGFVLFCTFLLLLAMGISEP